MSLDNYATAGGWRLLCAGMLLQAVQRAEESSKLYKSGKFGMGYSWRNSRKGADKEIVKQRVQAREWLDGGIGTVTFEECCETLELDPGMVRQKVLQYCREGKRKPLRSYEVAGV